MIAVHSLGALLFNGAEKEKGNASRRMGSLYGSRIGTADHKFTVSGPPRNIFHEQSNREAGLNIR